MSEEIHTDVLRFSLVLGLLPDYGPEPEYSIARDTIQAGKPHLLGRRLLYAIGLLTGSRPSCPRGTPLGRRCRLVIQPRKWDFHRGWREQVLGLKGKETKGTVLAIRTIISPAIS
jgi:hypothetical protein